MEQLLWYVLAGSRGGPNRIRIIEILRERPYNANQLAEKVGLDYRTMRHHLDILVKNNILARPSAEAYGAMYFLSGTMLQNLALFDRICSMTTSKPGEIMAKKDNPEED